MTSPSDATPGYDADHDDDPPASTAWSPVARPASAMRWPSELRDDGWQRDLALAPRDRSGGRTDRRRVMPPMSATWSVRSTPRSTPDGGLRRARVCGRPTAQSALGRSRPLERDHPRRPHGRMAGFPSGLVGAALGGWRGRAARQHRGQRPRVRRVRPPMRRPRRASRDWGAHSRSSARRKACA